MGGMNQMQGGVAGAKQQLQQDLQTAQSQNWQPQTPQLKMKIQQALQMPDGGGMNPMQQQMGGVPGMGMQGMGIPGAGTGVPGMTGLSRKTLKDANSAKKGLRMGCILVSTTNSPSFPQRRFVPQR